jgi:hypothetical protein
MKVLRPKEHSVIAKNNPIGILSYGYQENQCLCNEFIVFFLYFVCVFLLF